MRPASFAPLFLTLLAAACDSTKIEPVTVQWMDWPWQVAPAQAFRTRLVVWGVCAQNPRFRAGGKADQSAVTFEPYFIADKDPVVCVASPVETFALIAIDTAGMEPGLQAARDYDMRAAAPILQIAPPESETRSIITYGTVNVALPGDLIVGGRRNAAGFVSKEIDANGCVRIRPAGLWGPNAALVLENPVDTAGLSDTFVKGYIQEVSTPVCGETTVFHLESRN